MLDNMLYTVTIAHETRLADRNECRRPLRTTLGSALDNQKRCSIEMACKIGTAPRTDDFGKLSRLIRSVLNKHYKKNLLIRNVARNLTPEQSKEINQNVNQVSQLFNQPTNYLRTTNINFLRTIRNQMRRNRYH